MNPKLINKIAIGTIYGLVLMVVIILIALISYILISGLPNISWHFLISPSQSVLFGGGIRDQLFNTIYLLVLTLVISFPIALGAGIYLAEYAPQNRYSLLIKTIIEVLSSLPSVVVGLFCYLLFVVKMHIGFSILSGAIALTFFNLPLLTRNIENALESVSRLQKQAGMALGLSKWITVTRIILPAALPGIITGIILNAGRILGEAAALIYTAGQSSPLVDYTNWNIFSDTSFLNPMRPAETLAVHIWKINSEGVISDAEAISSGSSAVLIMLIVIFDILAHIIGKRLYQKMTSSI